MKKDEFLKSLESELAKRVQKNEVNEVTCYYSELIDDLMESGKTEEEAIDKLPNPVNIAKNISEKPAEIEDKDIPAAIVQIFNDEKAKQKTEKTKVSEKPKSTVVYGPQSGLKKQSAGGIVLKILGLLFFCITLAPIIVAVAAAVFSVVVALWSVVVSFIISGAASPIYAVLMAVLSKSTFVFFAYAGAGLLLLGLGLLALKPLIGVSKGLFTAIKRMLLFIVKAFKA